MTNLCRRLRGSGRIRFCRGRHAPCRLAREAVHPPRGRGVSASRRAAPEFCGKILPEGRRRAARRKQVACRGVGRRLCESERHPARRLAARHRRRFWAIRSVLPGTGAMHSAPLHPAGFPRLHPSRVQRTNKSQSLVVGPDGDPMPPGRGLARPIAQDAASLPTSPAMLASPGSPGWLPSRPTAPHQDAS